MSLTQTIKDALPRPAFEAAKSARDTIRPFLDRRRRLAVAMRYFSPKLAMARDWSLKDTEISNFNYDITDLSKTNLANMLSVVFSIPTSEVYAIFKEVENDTALTKHISSVYKARHRDVAAVYVGRRLGWYATVRLLKPKLVVETGVDMGLGSCVICAALLRNAIEGHNGRYIGTDIVTSAGVLYSAPYNSVGRIAYGDSIETLKTIDQPIDLFINDSDHSAEYEAAEYEVIAPKLSKIAVVLGDNSHSTSKLAEFQSEMADDFFSSERRRKITGTPAPGSGFPFLDCEAVDFRFLSRTVNDPPAVPFSIDLRPPNWTILS